MSVLNSQPIPPPSLPPLPAGPGNQKFILCESVSVL